MSTGEDRKKTDLKTENFAIVGTADWGWRKRWRILSWLQYRLVGRSRFHRDPYQL